VSKKKNETTRKHGQKLLKHPQVTTVARSNKPEKLMDADRSIKKYQNQEGRPRPRMRGGGKVACVVDPYRLSKVTMTHLDVYLKVLLVISGKKAKSTGACEETRGRGSEKKGLKLGTNQENKQKLQKNKLQKPIKKKTSNKMKGTLTKALPDGANQGGGVEKERRTEEWGNECLANTTQ